MFLHPCCLAHFQEHCLFPGAGQSIELLLFRKVALIGVEATAIEILLRYSFISFLRTATTGDISYDMHIWSNFSRRRFDGAEEPAKRPGGASGGMGGGIDGGTSLTRLSQRGIADMPRTRPSRQPSEQAPAFMQPLPSEEVSLSCGLLWQTTFLSQAPM